jgi:hypothetical protein
MNTASLENCKRLYELSGWEETAWQWLEDKDEGLVLASADHWKQNDKQICPAYDSGYLLRKLPLAVVILKDVIHHNDEGKIWQTYRYKAKLLDGINDYWYDTPEDALTLLSIKLFEEGILK